MEYYNVKSEDDSHLSFKLTEVVNMLKKSNINNTFEGLVWIPNIRSNFGWAESTETIKSW